MFFIRYHVMYTSTHNHNIEIKQVFNKEIGYRFFVDSVKYIFHIESEYALKTDFLYLPKRLKKVSFSKQLFLFTFNRDSADEEYNIKNINICDTFQYSKVKILNHEETILSYFSKSACSGKLSKFGQRVLGKQQIYSKIIQFK